MREPPAHKARRVIPAARPCNYLPPALQFPCNSLPDPAALTPTGRPLRADIQTYGSHLLTASRGTVAGMMRVIGDHLHGIAVPWRHRGGHVDEITAGWDATHANLHAAPAGQGAGYTTGSPDIRWTDADWDAHHGAVRICQDATGSDHSADVIDDEPGADSDSGSVGWYREAVANWTSRKTPGQRHPCFYCDQAKLLALGDAVTAAGYDTDVPLHLADYSLTLDEARQRLGKRTGPFLIVAVQFANRGTYDSDVWLTSWLNSQSVPHYQPPPPVPPTFTEVIMQELPTLKRGDSGRFVRTLQALLVARYRRLGETGSLHDGIDGDYGATTEAAVRDLQGESGLKVDGICGPATWPHAAGVSSP